MGVVFQVDFEVCFLVLNVGYIINVFGLDVIIFIIVLVMDVFFVVISGVIIFFDGINVFIGCNFSDDVIDIELFLIFGGLDGLVNVGLIFDNVDVNDVVFLFDFFYLVKLW